VAQSVAALLVVLAACPFTAPFCLCKLSVAMTASAGDGVAGATERLAATRSADTAVLAADSTSVPSDPTMTEDPMQDDALLPSGVRVPLVAAAEAVQPRVAGLRSAIRPVATPLRL
jgi:hypothetical protein